jgi:hypothetical protein
MGNRWQRAGDATNPKGSVAFLGCTHVVGGDNSEGRHLVTIGIFMGIFANGNTVLGDAFLYGKSYMWDNFNPEWRDEENHGWTLLGDPTLDIWNNTPMTMTVTHPSAIEMDKATDITVTVTDQASGQPIQDAWVTLYKQIGVIDDPEIYFEDTTSASGQVTFTDVTVPTAGKLKVTATYHDWTDVYASYQGEIGVFEIMTNDPQALANNGNRHLVREPNTNKFHLVYTHNGHVYYRNSTDGGQNWSMCEDVGAGSYPCIALGPLNAPAVTWTNGDGYMYFAKKSGVSWQTTLLYQPTPPTSPLVNSPPAMIIKVGDEGLPSTVNILVTLTGQGVEPVTHQVRHYYFDFNSPSATFLTVETAVAPIQPLRRHSPTLVRNELDNSLHAAWMRMDTICYARKAVIGAWVKYGNPFTLPHGILSAYPFVESYGDSIYLVWQEKESPTAPEEIWRGRRSRVMLYPWEWWPLSVTPSTVSLLPVNASGLFTSFVDETSNPDYDIFFKIFQIDPLTNISQTPNKSYYPHTAARFTELANYLYTVWLEGNSAPYEIKFKTWATSEDRGEIAFLSSFSGDSVMSPYLSSRDGYKPEWQIPVDYGNQQLTYRLPLDPAYLYKAKVIAYHEKTSEWRTVCRIDGGSQMVIKYNPHVPETLTFWIPTQLYQDSVIEVTLTKVVGDFVSLGQIYVYRYEQEYGSNGGPQSSIIVGLNKTTQLQVQPNPVTKDFTIAYTLQKKSNVELAIYDAVGRKIKTIVHAMKPAGNHKETVTNLALPQGVYFVQLVSDNTAIVSKVIFVR